MRSARRFLVSDGVLSRKKVTDIIVRFMISKDLQVALNALTELFVLIIQNSTYLKCILKDITWQTHGTNHGCTLWFLRALSLILSTLSGARTVRARREPQIWTPFWTPSFGPSDCIHPCPSNCAAIESLLLLPRLHPL